MKLFYSPGACSLAVHIVLRETNAEFALEKVDLGRHQRASGDDFHALNAKGQVPLLLLDDGAVLSEGPIIAQYVAERAAALTLLPAAASMARYRVLEWQNYVSAELHKSFTPLFNTSFDARARAVHAAVLGKKLAWVDTMLSGRDYLTGSDLTIADAYLFAVARWSGHVGLDTSGLAHLQRFIDRVAARPAVHAALKAEGLLD